MGLITNGTVRSQGKKLDALGLRPYFQSVIVSEAVGVKKPHPAIFQWALAEVGVPPQQAWFVGDHPENDILGASHAGLRPVWLAGVHPWPTAYARPPDQIHSLWDLVPLIRAKLSASR